MWKDENDPGAAAAQMLSHAMWVGSFVWMLENEHGSRGVDDRTRRERCDRDRGPVPAVVTTVAGTANQPKGEGGP